MGLDTELFFSSVDEETAAPAIAICDTCDVREKCLAWAIQNREPYGVWGGTLPKERRRMIRRSA